MSTDHMILGAAVAIFLACLVYAAKGKRLPSLPAALTQAARPSIRTAFDAIEEEARTLAAQQIAKAMAAHMANEHQGRIKAAFTASPDSPSPKEQPPAT